MISAPERSADRPGHAPFAGAAALGTNAAMAAPAEHHVTLFVDGGRHLGAAHTLSEGTYRIGASLDADIVLTDPGVAPFHCLLIVDTDGTLVEPLEQAVTVGGTVVEPGAYERLALPRRLGLGECGLLVRQPQPIVRRRRPWRDAATAMIVLAVGGYSALRALDATATLADNGAVTARLSEVAAAGPEPPETGVAQRTSRPAPEPAPAPPRRSTSQTASQALRTKLRVEDLDGLLRVSGTDGLLRVEGRLTKADLARWRVIHQWFDRHYGGRAVVICDITESAATPPPPIALQAIYATRNPFIVAGGQRIPIGTRVANRWTVEAISTATVRVRDLDGSRHTLRLNIEPTRPALLAGHPNG